MTPQELIDKWWGRPGGAEQSNFQSFIGDLCSTLDLETPEPSEKGRLGAYEYEASVPGGSFRSTKGTGAIDLYRRGHFIMEAKQSYLKPQQVSLDLDEDSVPRAPSGARYDTLMHEAWLQARNYARNLPSGEPASPFLIVCDVGRAFEIYVDPAGNGRDYDFFPDRQTYRIELTELSSDAEVARTGKSALELLRAIWTAPKSIDPRLQAAEITRNVAATLAEIMTHLEADRKIGIASIEDASIRSVAVEETSLFLMRLLFCMFAEDVELLPKKSFENFLESCLVFPTVDQTKPEIDENRFRKGLEDIWRLMATKGGDRYSLLLNEEILHFNGSLFEDRTVFRLFVNDLERLIAAAKTNWRRVEPAIFGTLLEQALDPKERSKLGAHYTPRPYVETLVRATIMDVLEPEWEALQHEHRDDEAALLLAAQVFHEELAATRVLDPACGTGNFLYVSMELMQALESRVLDLIQKLGGKAKPRIGPQQFYGLELNPRAAKIAELVLWIGWLRNRLKDDPEAVPEPVLKRSANLNMGRRGRYDALLRLTETGEPDYSSPMMAEWPKAEFIVGNPPFIGGKGNGIRSVLGDAYSEAMWAANTRVPKSADFVMQWWDRAAYALMAKGSTVQRFGFVTTNSITQEFSRRVIAQYLEKPSPFQGKGGTREAAEGEGTVHHSANSANDRPLPPAPSPKGEGETALSLVMAIPDHPWTKATKDAAAVRIAMTVAERGAQDGSLREVTSEAKLDSDAPEVVLAGAKGRINANLTVGADVTSARPLLANDGLSCNGMMLAGQGFKLSREDAWRMAVEQGSDTRGVLRGYIGGAELLRGHKGQLAIDFGEYSEQQARSSFPRIFDHLLATVKPERDKKRDKSLREKWWIFGRTRPQLRDANDGLDRYIATTETSKHRVFQFVDTLILPDHMVVAIGSDDAFHLGVMQSCIHTNWCLQAGGWLGFGNDNRYTKSKVFDPFPFPDANEAQRSNIADLAEDLDATRKQILTETDKLTMTELYNLRAKLRSGDPLSDRDVKRIAEARARTIDHLHTQLDQAVADAYGWGPEWAAGELGPSEIVSRLVALNHERAAEEAEGKIRWLRPDYQIPRFAPDNG